MSETKKNSSGSAAEIKYGVVITNKPNPLSPERREVLLNCSAAETLTEQSHKDDCDINNIVKRHSASDLFAASAASNPMYGDFSSSNDYKEALDTVIYAQEQFQGLPATVREKFNNDPASFLEFVSDSKNAQEMISLGLAHKVQPSDSQALQNAISGLTEGVKALKGEPESKK